MCLCVLRYYKYYDYLVGMYEVPEVKSTCVSIWHKMSGQVAQSSEGKPMGVVESSVIPRAHPLSLLLTAVITAIFADLEGKDDTLPVYRRC